MPERKVRDPDELRGASDSLFYEYWMLKGLADLLGHGCFVEDEPMRNAALESFLIHARALVDFFYERPEKPPRKDDAIALDFLRGADQEWWKAQFTGDPDWYPRTRVDKTLAHISYERVKKDWDCLAIDYGITQAMLKFIQRVPLDLLGRRWDATKRNIAAGECCIELLYSEAKRHSLKTSFYPQSAPDWHPEGDG